MNVLCYPNPTSGQLTIEVKNTIPTIIEIYDSLGRQVLKSSFSERIDLSYIPSGLYFVRVLDANNQLLVQKIIKE